MKPETRVGIFILIAISIFLYLSISIRAFRLDRDQFNMYKAYFDDVGGLAVRASVKIAGVEVGWIDSIDLLNDGRAEVIMEINKTYKLAKNAYAMVHQEGLIGTKTLVIDSGDPSTGFLMPGSTLSMPGRTPASVGELLDQFKDIASSIHDIASSFKTVFANRQAENNMRKALESMSNASERFADLSLTLQDVMHNNQNNINKTLADIKSTVESIKNGVPEIKENVCNTSKKVGSAFEQVEDASVQAKDTFKEAGKVVEKINTGKGLIGKLINEDETYADMKKTVRGLKDYVGKTQALMLNIDMHSESMLRHSNSKGYFDLKLRPNSDCFYNIQLVADEFGSIKREVTNIARKDEHGNMLHPADMSLTPDKKLKYADSVERTTRTKNDILFGLQFGKRFDRLAFRIGLFENSFGVGCDYYVPLTTDKFHWISTIEAFDFSGTRRLNDTRPHVKWLNKLFFLKNMYTTFGVDDIYSKNNANPFVGAGLRFGDDDLKYFLGYMPISKAGSK